MRPKGFISSIIAGFLGVCLSAAFVPGFSIQGTIPAVLKILMLAGLFLGLIIFFIKPLIDLITWPLRWLTLGLFSLVIYTGMAWILEILFHPEISIAGFKSLFFCGIFIFLASWITPKKSGKTENN